MAATFARETAKIKEVYRRRVYSGGAEKYIRLPFNLVTHDNGTEYIEPLPFQNTDLAKTWYDTNNDATNVTWLVVDTIPFDGITEIR